jgi:flagellar FliJ protein
MKRFRFRLERLLRLKRQKERLAEMRQLHARGVCEAAEHDVARSLDQLVRGAAIAQSPVGQPIETDLWIAQYHYMTQLRQAVDAAETTAELARATLGEANRARQAAAADAELLVRLRKRKWEQYRAETARAEQQWLDELWLSGVRRR